MPEMAYEKIPSGAVFSAMDSSSTMPPSLSTSFQWGHDFSAMDRLIKILVLHVYRPGFNGATTFQPWIGYGMAFLWDIGVRFNGATTFQPWIGRILGILWLVQPIFKFQWGHDFSAMDRAAIFRPLLLSKKLRFARGSSTPYKTFRELTLVRRQFRYAGAFRAGPRVLDTTPPLARRHLLIRGLFGPF